MRVLRFHATRFEYEPKEKTKLAVGVKGRKTKFRDVLVCFTAFEEGDESRVEEIIEKYKSDLKKDTKQLGTKKILIYPYAHLSKDLGSPKKAKEFFRNLKECLREEGAEVSLAPFGWYKKVKTEIKGHPLAESYREY